MLAIAKRDLKYYFSSFIGYFCVAVIMFLFGLFYYMYVYSSGISQRIPYVWNAMFTWGMMIIPIITMRAFSEDRKNKTDQALITAPVSVTAIVMGKWLAAFAVYFIMMTCGLLPCIALNFVGTVNWGMVFGNYFASLFYGAAMIAIGVYISSLTTSQIIAAIATFAVSIILLILDSLSSALGTSTNAIANLFYRVLSWISFNSRYAVFAQGLFSIENVIFFASLAAVFIFLTARKLESRRWR